MRLIARGLHIARNDGAMALLFRALSLAVYRRLLLFETDLREREFTPDARCRWLRDDEVEAYAQCDTRLSPQEIRAQLQGGARCWVLQLPSGELAHGLWVATTRKFLPYIDQDFVMTPDEAYLYRSCTPPQHRGQRYASCALGALKAELAQRGVRRTLSCVLPDNRLAYPPVFRNGARPVAYIGWYGIGPWRRTFRTPTSRLPWYAPTPHAAAIDAHNGADVPAVTSR